MIEWIVPTFLIIHLKQCLIMESEVLWNALITRRKLICYETCCFHNWNVIYLFQLFKTQFYHNAACAWTEHITFFLNDRFTISFRCHSSSTSISCDSWPTITALDVSALSCSTASLSGWRPAGSWRRKRGLTVVQTNLTTLRAI